VIEAAGQALIWLAPAPWLALLGAALTGLGYSLVYPGFGVEAVLRVPADSRGLAMGAYTAFLDLALGAGGPLLGLVASDAGLGSVFLVGALAALAAVPIAARMLRGGPLESLLKSARAARRPPGRRLPTADGGSDSRDGNQNKADTIRPERASDGPWRRAA